MKKLFLLTLSSCFAFASFAQQNSNESVVLKAYQGERYKVHNLDDPGSRNIANKSAAKTNETLGGSRWYEPFALSNAYVGGSINNNTFVFPIGYDSTYRQFFTNDGWVSVNWLAFAQFIDPIRSLGFNTADPNFYGASDVRVNWWNPYTVDSVYFRGAYVKGPDGDPATIDTFIISVAPVPYDYRQYTQQSTYKGDVNTYDKVSDNGGVLLAQQNLQVDYASRTLNYPGVVTFKVPIEDTNRKDVIINTDGSRSFATKTYIYGVPGGLNVPAGNGFAIAVAFKNGEPNQNPLVDSVQRYHHFMPIAAEREDGQQMGYFGYAYEDFNMSYLLHYEGTNFSSAIGLELVNGNQFSYEYLNVAGKVTCATCNVLSVENVTNFTSVKAYPNPASTEVRIPFTLKSAADVNVTIANAVGQVVKSQNLGNTTSGEATFNISDLVNGVYFYTVEANGQRSTGRISVSH